jgi:transposase
MTKAEIETKQKLARVLYFSGQTGKEIAETTGVSEPSISNWVNKFGWDKQRAAKFVTRPELVNKLLLSIDNLINKLNEQSEHGEDTSKTLKQIKELSQTIQNLDKSTNIVTLIEICTDFEKWLGYRKKLDKDLSEEFIRQINRYHQIYIEESMSANQKA